MVASSIARVLTPLTTSRPLTVLAANPSEDPASAIRMSPDNVFTRASFGVPMASTVPLALSSCTSPFTLVTLRSPARERSAHRRAKGHLHAVVHPRAELLGPSRDGPDLDAARRLLDVDSNRIELCLGVAGSAADALDRRNHDVVAAGAVDDDRARQVEDVERAVGADLERAGHRLDALGAAARVLELGKPRRAFRRGHSRGRQRRRPPSWAAPAGSASRTSKATGQAEHDELRGSDNGRRVIRGKVSVTTCSCHRQSGPLRPGCPSGLR